MITLKVIKELELFRASQVFDKSLSWNLNEPGVVGKDERALLVEFISSEIANAEFSVAAYLAGIARASSQVKQDGIDKLRENIARVKGFVAKIGDEVGIDRNQFADPLLRISFIAQELQYLWGALCLDKNGS